MTIETTNPVDGEAMPEVADDQEIENDELESAETNQEDDDDEGQQYDDEGEDDGTDEGQDADAELDEVEWEGKAFKAPKGVKEAMLRMADYTRKTQEVAEVRKAVEAKEQAVRQIEERQVAFAGDIAALGALDARLKPYAVVTNWGEYLRQGGAQAQADYADYQALTQERDAFVRSLSQKVQERTALEQQERAKAIEAGRAELAKHIKGYGPETLSKMEAFAAPLGFSPEEIREAEADPRSLRILHLAMVGQQALQQQKKTSSIAQGAKTQPAKTLRGAGFAAGRPPEQMTPAQMAKHLGLS